MTAQTTTGHYLTTRRDGCTCSIVRPSQRERGSGVLIEPPEWEQADDCPVHPAAVVDVEDQCAHRACELPRDTTAPAPYDRYCSDGCADDDAHAEEQRRHRDALYLLGEASRW